MIVVAAAALTCGLSLLVGQALCSLLGSRGWEAAAPAIGLAGLLALARVGVALPGEEVAAAALVAVASAAAALVIARRRAAGHLRLAPAARLALPLLALVALGLALPFLAGGRIGPLGVGVNDDFAFHLLWADALATRDAPLDLIRSGYPIGPHALAAALAAPLGDTEEAFIGLVLALPALAALSALAGLRGAPAPLRVAGAAIVGLPYLAAGFLVQGGFKELTVSLLALGTGLHLRRLERGAAWDLALMLPLALLAVGCVLVYGHNGLAWLAAVAGIFGVIAAALRSVPRPSRGRLAQAARAAAVAVVLGLVLLAPELGRLDDLARGGIEAVSSDDARANATEFNRQLPVLEVTGVWFSADLRQPQRGDPATTALAVLALGLALFGGWWHLRRREAWLPATAAGCLAIYLFARIGSIGFYSAKALAIAAPPVMLMTVRAIAVTAGTAAAGRVRTAAAAATLVLLLVAGVASAEVLRNGTVRPEGREDELGELRPLVQGGRLLFLGHDPYAMWDLRGSRFGTPFPLAPEVSEIGVPVNHPARPSAFATPDFDFLPARALDRFDRAITLRTGFLSFPPPNWRPIAHTTQYTLWERRAPSPQRGMLRERDEPGAILRCDTPRGRRIRGQSGTAVIRTPPVIGAAAAWAPGDASATGPDATVPIPPGATLTQTITLPPGRHHLALMYTGRHDLTVAAGGTQAEVPALLTRQRQHLPAGSVRSGGGPLTVSVTSDDKPALAPGIEGLLGSVVAVPAAERPRRVPLRSACHRYVDWYLRD